MPSSNTRPAIAAYVARQMAQAYGPGTRDYSSIQQPQPQSQPQGSVADLFRALLAERMSTGTRAPNLMMRPYQNAATDSRLMDADIGTGYSASSGRISGTLSGITDDMSRNPEDFHDRLDVSGINLKDPFALAVWKPHSIDNSKALDHVIRALQASYYGPNGYAR